MRAKDGDHVQHEISIGGRYQVKLNNLGTYKITPSVLEYGSVLKEELTLLLLHPLDNSIGGAYGSTFRESGGQCNVDFE
jgi:hypothetical protein